ncbi:hypothetical protein V6N12_007286 [Hibiscus sabdariffa]|uniref:Uncharacterized protein n=1 Tax=Hibiscus sabdariffa TaxID=183260 RepID=A0ABR2F1C3_9ROSI
MPGDSFKVLPLRTDADCLNIVVELPRNHHVHIYLVEIDESVGPQAEPFVETEYEFEEPSPYSEIGPEFESQVELVVAVLVEPFEPQDEPPFIPQREPVFVAQTKPFETQDEPPFAPQTELVVATQTDSSDTEYLGSTTESESSFEDSDYSVEDIEEIKRSSHGTWKQPAPAISAPTLQDQTNTSAPAQQGSTQPPPIQVVRWMLNNSQESSTTQPPTHL